LELKNKFCLKKREKTEPAARLDTEPNDSGMIANSGQKNDKPRCTELEGNL
jgi:hypothetical protein